MLNVHQEARSSLSNLIRFITTVIIALASSVLIQKTLSIEFYQLKRYYNGTHPTDIIIVFDNSAGPKSQEYDYGTMVIETMIQYFAETYENATTPAQKSATNNSLEIHLFDLTGRNALIDSLTLAKKYFTRGRVKRHNKLLLVITDSRRLLEPSLHIRLLFRHFSQKGIPVLLFSQSRPPHNRSPGYHLVAPINYYGYTNFTQILDDIEDQNTPETDFY